jgi:hypothetical protein
MSKKDLSNCTFLIPLRIETDDRMRNITTIIAYLLTNFNTNIIIKEYDSHSVFQESVIPMLECGFDENELKNIVHIFEKTEEYVFHRTRLINDMVLQSTTPVVVNYDSDILLPIESYPLAVELITSGQYKCVYPYGYGDWQYQITTNDSEVTDCRFGRTRIAWDGDGPWAAVDSTGELVGVFEVWLERIAKPTVVFQAR